MTRFPTAIRELRKRHPKAETLAQVRIITRNGSTMTLEGAVTLNERDAIVRAVVGAESMAKMVLAVESELSAYDDT